MAKMKDELDFDDDDDLDNYGDDGFGDWDDFDAAPKKRNPVARLAGSFIDGVKSTFMNRETHRKFVKEALPPGYDRIYDTADETLSSVKDLYDTARDGAGESAKEIKKGVNAIVPQLGNGIVPERMRNRMMNWAASEKQEGRATIDQDDAEMQMAMGDMFGGARQSEEAYGDSEGGPTPLDAAEISNNIVDGIADKIQTAEGNNLMLGIKRAVERTANFQDQVHMAFMKKSIELQYRHFFVARKSLDVLTQMRELQVSSFDKIVHNTALPDLVKTQSSEIAGQMLKEKFMGEVIQSGSEHFGNVGRKIIMKSKEKVKGFFKDIGAQVQEGIFGLTQVSELLGDKDSGINMDDLVAQGAGGFLGTKLMDKLTPILKEKLKDNPQLQAIGLSAMNAQEQGFRIFQELLENDTGVGWLESLKWTGVFDEFGFKRNETIRTDATMELDKAAQWDIQSKKTLNEVIPGWLSKIHAELAATRTNTEPDPLEYSFETGMFERSADVRERIRESIMGKKQIEGTAKALNDFIKVIDPDKELSVPAQEAFKRYVFNQGASRRMLNFEAIRDGRTRLSDSDDVNRELVSAVIKNYFKQSEEDEYEFGDGTILSDIDRNLRRDVLQQQSAAKMNDAMGSLMSEMKAFDKQVPLQQTKLGRVQHLNDLGITTLDGSTHKLNLNGILDEVINQASLLPDTDTGAGTDAAEASEAAAQITQTIRKSVGTADRDFTGNRMAVSYKITEKNRLIKVLRALQKKGQLPPDDQLDFPIIEGNGDGTTGTGDEGGSERSFGDRAKGALGRAGTWADERLGTHMDVAGRLTQAEEKAKELAERLKNSETVNNLRTRTIDLVDGALEEVDERLGNVEGVPDTQEGTDETGALAGTKRRGRKVVQKVKRKAGDTELGRKAAEKAGRGKSWLNGQTDQSLKRGGPQDEAPEADVKHAGGIAGADGPKRKVVGARFTGAMRYHSGGIAGEKANPSGQLTSPQPNDLEYYGAMGLELTETPGKFVEYGVNGRPIYYTDAILTKNHWDDITPEMMRAALSRLNATRSKSLPGDGGGSMKTVLDSQGVPQLGYDEVPAVLQEGEEVLTGEDPRHRKNIFKTLKDVFGKIRGKAPGAIGDAIDSLTGMVDKVSDIIGDQNEEPSDQLPDPTQLALPDLTDETVTQSDPETEAKKGLFGRLKDMISRVSGGASSGVDMATESVKSTMAGDTSAEDTLGRIYETTLTMVELLQTIAEKQFAGMPEGFVAKWRRRVTDGFTGAKDWTGDKLKTGREKLSAGFTTLRDKAGEWKAKLVDGERLTAVKDFVSDKFGKVKDGVVGAGKTLKQKGSETYDKTRDRVKGLKDKVTGKLDGIRNTISDIYVTGEADPIIKKISLEGGGLIDGLTEKSVSKLEDITGPVIDQSGNLIVTWNDFNRGLSYAGIRQRIKSSAASRMGAAKGFATGKLGIVKDLIKGFKDKVTGKVKAYLDGITDVYVTGESEPIIKRRQLENGTLINLTNGLTVGKLEDITGPVIDLLGTQVVTQSDFDKGLHYGGMGEKIKRTVKGIMKQPGTQFMKAVSWMRNKDISAPKFVKVLFGDVFIQGDPNPVLTVKQLRSGEYIDVKTQKPITKFADITGAVMGPDENLAITQEQFDKGLVDIWGKSIYQSTKASLESKFQDRLKGTGLLGKLYAFGERLLKDDEGPEEEERDLWPDIKVVGDDPGRTRVMSALLKQGGYILSETKQAVRNIDEITGGLSIKHGGETPIEVISQKEYDTAQFTDGEGKPIVLGKGKSTPKRSMLGRGLDKVKKLYGWAKGGIMSRFNKLKSGLFGKANAAKEADSITDEVIGFRKIYGLVAEVRDLIAERLSPPKKAKFNDKDGDGQRDGNAQKGFFGRVKDSFNEGREKAKEKKDAKGEGGGFNLMGMLGKGLLGAGIGAGVAALASHMMGGEITATKLAMGAAGGVAMMSSTVRKGLGKAAMWGAKAAGRGLMWGAKKVGGFALRSALPALGGLALKGAAAIGAVMSAPVALAIGATLLIAGAGYLIYKAMTNKPNPIFKLRMAQYGFPSGKKKNVEAILSLEKDLIKLTSVSKEGPAKLGAGKSGAEYLELFKVNPEDKEEVDEWKAWFHYRFKPVYLSHMTALYKQTNKKDLHQADTLMGRTEKLLYLKNVHFRNPKQSPYSVETNPFGDESKSLLDLGDVEKVYKRSVSDAEDEKEKASATEDEKKDAENLSEKDGKAKDDKPDAEPEKKESLAMKLMKFSAPGLAMSAAKSIYGAASKVMEGITGNVDSNDTSASWWSRGGAAIRNATQRVKRDLGMENDYRDTVSGGGSLKWSSKAPPELFKEIENAAAKHNVPADFLKVMAYTESRGDPTAKNPSGAKGVYQFIPIAAKQYGITGREFDMPTNVDAGARMAADNKKIVERITGKPAEPYQMYLAHQQGPGGIEDILKSAAAGAQDVRRSDVRRNMNNNMGQGKTPAQFVQYWKERFGGYMSQLRAGNDKPSSTGEGDPAGKDGARADAGLTPGSGGSTGDYSGAVAQGNNAKMTQQQIIERYGQPNAEGTYLTTIELPYPMRLSWEPSKTVKTMRVHKLAAKAFLGVFNDLLKHYGYSEIKRLGIDLFGGCFNYRKMRGGNSLSRHSWGIAIDLDPVRNGMKSTRANAQFAKPEYKPMLDIFARYGFISYGVTANFDWMHFELGTAANSNGHPLVSKLGDKAEMVMAPATAAAPPDAPPAASPSPQTTVATPETQKAPTTTSLPEPARANPAPVPVAKAPASAPARPLGQKPVMMMGGGTGKIIPKPVHKTPAANPPPVARTVDKPNRAPDAIKVNPTPVAAAPAVELKAPEAPKVNPPPVADPVPSPKVQPRMIIPTSQRAKPTGGAPNPLLGNTGFGGLMRTSLMPNSLMPTSPTPMSEESPEIFIRSEPVYDDIDQGPASAIVQATQQEQARRLGEEVSSIQQQSLDYAKRQLSVQQNLLAQVTKLVTLAETNDRARKQAARSAPRPASGQPPSEQKAPDKSSPSQPANAGPRRMDEPPIPMRLI